MVRPVGHFDTPNRVFLLLEHAQRGALWNSLERFQEEVHQRTASTSDEAPADGDLGESDHSDGGKDLQPAWSGPLAGPTAARAVPESRVRRWAAQIVSALGHLHSSGFIWRYVEMSGVEEHGESFRVNISVGCER